MGSLPRLKIKDEIRYRKGSTNESSSCRACASFVPVTHFLKEGILSPGTVRGEGRCRLIGLSPGARYRVHEDNTCDRQAMGEAWRRDLERLRRPSPGLSQALRG